MYFHSDINFIYSLLSCHLCRFLLCLCRLFLSLERLRFRLWLFFFARDRDRDLSRYLLWLRLLRRLFFTLALDGHLWPVSSMRTFGSLEVTVVDLASQCISVEIGGGLSDQRHCLRSFSLSQFQLINNKTDQYIVGIDTETIHLPVDIWICLIFIR